MVQIIEENRRPSSAEKFSNAFSGGLNAVTQFMLSQKQKKQELEQMQRKNERLRDLTGMDLSDLPESMQQKGLESSFARQLQSDKFGFESQNKAEDLKGKFEPLMGAMDSLHRMRALRKKGKLGIGSTYSPFESTRRDAGEYEQLGKSLIQYATNIPIRNRIEFETLAEQLYDPTITDAKAEGILDAMERIINNSLRSLGGEIESPRSVNKKERPPLTSFQR